MTPPETPARSALDWDEVRLFLAVAREGSLAGAGSRLGLDVSTVSRRLSRLEGSLGAALFDRGREGTSPTALAEQLVTQAEEMEVLALNFAAAGSQVETRVEGTVRLTAPPGICDLFVAPRLPELLRRHPALRLELDASIGYADLTRREADLALRLTLPQSGDLLATKAIEARSVPMAAPDYARALGRLRALDQARWIAWGPALTQYRDAVWLRTYGGDLSPVLVTDHFQSQLSAARAGLGALVAPEPYSIVGLVPLQHTAALEAAWAALPLNPLWLVGHRALRQVPRVAEVWRFLLEVFATPAATTAQPNKRTRKALQRS